VLGLWNPPEGFWVVKYWGPWLDKTHPNPAKPGELRWFTTVAGEDREVDGPGPHLIEGSTSMLDPEHSSEQPCPTTQTSPARIMLPSWRVSRKNYVAPIETVISRSAFEMRIFR
jgi:hypothetical protein